MEEKKEISPFEQQTRAYAQHWSKTIGRRDFLKLSAIIGGAAVFNSVLAGCQPEPTETPVQPTSATGSPKKGGVIKIGRVSDSDSLDPHKSSLLAAHEIMTNIYDPLVYLDAAGNLYPCLAESWDFSNENKTVTFKLRKGVKFHDGTPFNAEAMKYSVNRHTDPATASPTSWMLGDFDKVEVIDEYTVAYHYKVPFVALWVGLGYSYCAPVSKAAVEKFGDDFGRNPVGTGPFKFVSWEPDKGVTLTRNSEHSWGSTFFKNQGESYLDGAQYLIMPEDATRISALQTGDIDMIHGSDAVPLDKINLLNSTEGVKVVTTPSVGVVMAMMNTTFKPLDDKRLRQAINYAVDKDKLIKLVLDGNGTPAYSALPSSFSAVFDPDLKTKVGYEFNLDKAKALMKEAGKEAGFDVEFATFDGAFWKQIGEVVKEDLAKININVTVASMPVGELFAKAADGTMGIYQCWYTYGDPDIVYQFLHTEQSFWWDKHVNPELDKLIEDQRIQFDATKRKDIFFEIQRIVAEEAYWLPMYEGVYAAAMKDYVNGVVIDALGFHHLVDIWMDK